MIPTVLLSDLTHIIVYPDNATSYHLRFPLNQEGSLLEPMIVLKDEENKDRRELQLVLNQFLLNAQPFYFFSLYNWVCDPVWATYDYPEIADCPAKIGFYHININDFILAIFNSTSLPESSDHETGASGGVTLSAGAMVHSLLTNRNRIVIGIGGSCSVDCVMNGNMGTMQMDVGCSINRFACSKLRNIYSIPRDKSSLDIGINYSYDPSKSVSTIILVELRKSKLLLRKDDIADIIQIMTFQIESMSQYLLSSTTVSSTNEADMAVVLLTGSYI